MSKKLLRASTALAASAALYQANLARLEAEQFEPSAPSGNFVPGVIYLANASQFSESFYQQHLTDYSVGWRDPNDIEATRRAIAPEVEVPHMFEYDEYMNAEEFLSEDDDERQMGGNFKQVQPYKSVKRLGKLANRGLCILVDLDTVKGQPMWREKKVAKLLRRIARNRLKRGINLLSAAAVNTAKTWDTTAGKDPDMDVANELVTATTASGLGFNRTLYGHTAWAKRWTSFRAQNNAGGYASAGLTPEQLAALLNLDRVIVSKERYQSGAAAKTEIVSNKVIMYFAQDGVDQEDATNIKCFVGRPDGEGGAARGYYKVYEQQVSAKLVLLTVEYYELQKITSTLGIRQFTVS